jgi:hypothetical protein
VKTGSGTGARRRRLAAGRRGRAARAGGRAPR